MPYSYAKNNFSKALHALAQAGARKREWLSSKYVEHILLLELSDIPDELRQQFCEIRHALGYVKARHETKLSEAAFAAVHAMTADEVNTVVRRMEILHEAILQHERQKQDPVPARSQAGGNARH